VGPAITEWSNVSNDMIVPVNSVKEDYLKVNIGMPDQEFNLTNERIETSESCFNDLSPRSKDPKKLTKHI
jgi:hypothetical protein